MRPITSRLADHAVSKNMAPRMIRAIVVNLTLAAVARS